MQGKNLRLSAKGVALKDLLGGKTVIIFGAGIAGKGVLKILRQEKIPVAAFHDNGALQPYSVEGIPVARMNFSTLNRGEVVFILAIHNMDEAVKQLEESGGFSWLPAYDLLNEKTSALLSFMEFQKFEAMQFYFERFLDKKLLTLNSLDFVITERCSLRCRECSNLMQYYAAPKNFSVEDLKRELDLTCAVFDEIYEIRIIGGEPFVHPNWDEILQYIASKENIKRISIYTNGTLLPSDSQCEVLKATNAWLSISDYDELSRKLEPLKKKLAAYEIPSEVKAIPHWTHCSSFVKHNRTREELAEVFRKCCARDLATLLNGKLYPCPFISNAMNLKAIPAVENDFVDLTATPDLESLRQKVRKLFSRPFFDSCDRCTGRPTPLDIRDEDKIPPHEQTSKPLKYIKYFQTDNRPHKLSVVVPVYNVEKYLRQCLDSILNQTFKDFGLFLVNDGSIDDSLSICEEYARRDDRITLISQDNRGPSAARNVALELISSLSGGEFLSFVDADDYLEPQTFERFIEFMDVNSEVDICMCNGFVIDPHGQKRVMFPKSNDYEILDSKAALAILFGVYRFNFWAKMYRCSLLNDFKFDETLHMGEDILGNWRLFNRVRKVGIIPYRGYNYRINSLSLSAQSNNGFDHPYDLIKSAVKIYEIRGEDKDRKFIATQQLLNVSLSRLFRLLTQDNFEVKAGDVEYYLNTLTENKSEILELVTLSPEKKFLFDALTQPFDDAKRDCRKIYADFLNDLKTFYKSRENIFIYGTGNFGVEVGELLSKMNCTRYSFLTSNLGGNYNQRMTISGEEHDMTDLIALAAAPDETGIILAMNDKNKQEVLPLLQKKGYVNIFDANRLGIHI